MVGFAEEAVEVVRAGLARSDEPVEVTLSLSRKTAEKLLELLEAEGHSGAVVVPVKEQFTTTEAAKMLGISRPTLMKLINAGDINSVKVASHHRIPASAIRDYEHASGAGRERAAEAIEDFASDVRSGFQNNVTFGGRDR